MRGLSMTTKFNGKIVFRKSKDHRIEMNVYSLDIGLTKTKIHFQSQFDSE